MTHNELRTSFLNFFENRKHKTVKSSPVIPYEDPTLMFTNAGMNQFKDVLTGDEKRSYTRATSIQKCIRVSGKHNDFEIVGFDETHHTFFEMLGNWSFGDYYKKEAIEWAWEFLTETLKLSKKKMAVSIYKDDEESYNIWQKNIKIPENKIIRLGNIEKGDEENFWSMGDTGPCGFCSEIHYIDDNNPPDNLTEEILENQYIEIWNLVFMEFYRNLNGELTPLKNKNIDTGMGFERLYTILQNKKSNYHTDLFMPIINEIENLSKEKYSSNETSFQVIADHIRALTFSIGDGGHFSNEGRGYVLRKILRRAVRHSKKIGFDKPVLFKLVDIVINNMGEYYDDIIKKKDNIKKFIKIEEEKFLTTLDKGLNQLNTIITQLNKSKQNIISGKDVFSLYDTYGFPLDTTKEIAKENNLSIDEIKFHEHMEEQKSRGRKSWNTNNKSINIEAISQKLKNLPDTIFTGYEKNELEDKIIGIIKNNELIIDYEENNKNEIIGVILENTPFYAESGGQTGDTGLIFTQEIEFQVIDTKKYGNKFIHFGHLTYGQLKTDQKIIAKVNKEKRLSTMKNHTSTHLLQAALRKFVGDHIVQAGSFVSPERLRFDFRHYEAIDKEKLTEMENYINSIIQQNHTVKKFIKEKEEAIKMGAMAIFGEKYGEKVRVIKIDNISIELCGGTHLDSTGQIGLFLFMNEMSIASGIRRIEAITGMTAIKYLQNIRKQQNELKNILNASDETINKRIQQLIKDNKKLEKSIKSGKLNNINDTLSELVDSGIEKNDSTLIIHLFEKEDNKFVNSTGDNLIKKLKKGIVLLFNTDKEDDKFSVLLLVTPNILKEGFKANQIINKIANIFDGKGGGREDWAQAGGKKIKNLDSIIKKSKEIILNIL